jgi:hypothetical protein
MVEKRQTFPCLELEEAETKGVLSIGLTFLLILSLGRGIVFRSKNINKIIRGHSNNTQHSQK